MSRNYVAKPTRARQHAAPPLPPGARRPTATEQAQMIRALDQMLEDERRLREFGHNPTFAALYSGPAIEAMDAAIEGRPIHPGEMFRVLDMLDQHHRMAEAADQGMHRFHAERQALRDLAEAP